MSETAGLILCGGKSSRMGFDKAALRFGPRPLLDLVLERMRQVAGPVVVSLAAGAAPPRLPEGVRTIRDDAPEQGPLRGLLQGFRALAGHAEQVIVMPVDMPFFTPPWMERLISGLNGHRACMYKWEGFANALTAAYRLDLLPKLEALAAGGRMRPMFISEGEPTRVLTVESLWREGEGPPPLLDMDSPDAYRRALLMASIGNPGGVPVTVEIRRPGGNEAPAVAPLFAATAGEALDWVWRLYPELQPAVGSGEKGPAQKRARLRKIGKDGPGEAIPPNDPLQPEERLLLDLEG